MMKAIRLPSSWGMIAVAALLAATTIAIRVWFWQSAGETLEDSLITLRYAENIADGRGFTYNTVEYVLGTTTPLWTLLLASARTAGVTDLAQGAKVIGIACDVGTLLLLLLLLRKDNSFAPLLFAGVFATSPWIVRICVSGMETPLLLLSMSIALLGLQRRNSAFALGLALTLLTRIDGILFAGIMLLWSLFHDWRWTARQTGIMVLLCLPWIVFAAATFGTVLPQSFEAKRAVYHLGVATSAPPFLNVFTPLGETGVSKLIVKSLWTLVVLGSLLILVIRRGIFLPIAVFFLMYTVAYMMSGTLIFAWYIVPAVFISSICVAAATGWALARLKERQPRMSSLLLTGAFLLFVSINILALGGRMQRSRDVQEVENGLRKGIGVWLKEHTESGASILLEPIGYIGYYAGPDRKIMDEIGLVTPRIVPYRRAGAGWYVAALQALDPDYIVQYAAALERNRSEGTEDPLFVNGDQRAWFRDHYESVARFRLSGQHFRIEEKEKEYVVLRKIHS